MIEIVATLGIYICLFYMCARYGYSKWFKMGELSGDLDVWQNWRKYLEKLIELNKESDPDQHPWVEAAWQFSFMKFKNEMKNELGECDE